MKVAALDLGTNSFLMTIADIDIEKCKIKNIIGEYCEIVRLGRGLKENGIISESSIDRGLSILQLFSEELQKHSVERVIAVGTSVLREAKNSQKFIEKVKKKLNIKIDVISGEREALLSWKGSITDIAIPPQSEPVIVDIGGGSTEFVWNKGMSKVSIPFGVVKAFESHIKEDPPQPTELKSLKEEFRTLLEENLPKTIVSKKPIIITVAGTATTLSAIVKGVEPYDSSKIHGSKLNLKQLKETISLLTSLKLEDRKKIPGLHPGRADVIVAGAVMFEELFSFLNISEVIISDRGVRYGLLLKLAGC